MADIPTQELSGIRNLWFWLCVALAAIYLGNWPVAIFLKYSPANIFSKWLCWSILALAVLQLPMFVKQNFLRATAFCFAIPVTVILTIVGLLSFLFNDDRANGSLTVLPYNDCEIHLLKTDGGGGATVAFSLVVERQCSYLYAFETRTKLWSRYRAYDGHLTFADPSSLRVTITSSADKTLPTNVLIDLQN